MKCPECNSDNYYYEGTYICCNACGYYAVLPNFIIPDEWYVNEENTIKQKALLTDKET